jgi:CheY-like chemotaxis protein
MSGPEILIVENSLTQGLELQMMLEAAGYSTHLARDGEQALAYLQDHQPTLVLSAIVLPKLDGFQLCQRLKADPAHSHIPVVLLTSRTSPDLVAQGQAAGVDYLLVKPAERSALLSQLQAILAEQSAEQTTKSSTQTGPELLVHISHELRTRLSAILGFTRLMDRSPTFPAEHREYLQAISQDSEHLLTLINQLLEASKLEVSPSPANPASPPTRQVAGLAPQQVRYRILITDDSPTNRLLLRQMLEPFGFDLQVATNGEEALERWAAWQPHLIWLDMQMPLLNGYETARRIKATPQGQATVIVALTANPLKQEREVVLAAGCDDFVRKPFQTAELVEVMRRHLGLEYIYVDEVTVAPTDDDEAMEESLNVSEAVALLPPDLVAHLAEAADLLDMQQVDEVIAQIRSQQPALATRLAILARNFDYEQMVALIESANPPPDET